MLTAEEMKQMERNQRDMGEPKITPPHNRLPAELQKFDLWARFRFNPMIAKADNPYLPEEFQALYEESNGAEPPLGDLPLIVLIAGDPARSVEEQKALATNPNQQVFEEKRFQKIAQSRLSRSGRYLIVDGEHELHLSDPWIVIESIRQVVETVRGKKLSSTP
jgi:hypothetical protein